MMSHGLFSLLTERLMLHSSQFTMTTYNVLFEVRALLVNISLPGLNLQGRRALGSLHFILKQHLCYVTNSYQFYYACTEPSFSSWSLHCFIAAKWK